MRGPAAEIVDALHHAMRSQHPVRVAREHDWWAGDVSGFVVDVSGDWVALQRLVDAVYVDGYEILRLRDITEVDDRYRTPYVERAVAALGRPPADFRLPADATTATVLHAAAHQAELILVHTEEVDEDALMIGHLARLGSEDLDLQLVDPEGEWPAQPGRWRLEDVTRVGFGDRYSTALARYGDPRPAVSAEATDGHLLCTCATAPGHDAPDLPGG